MTLYQLGKLLLNQLGLLNFAARCKRRWELFQHKMKYRFLLFTRSKTAYLQYFDSTYKSLLQGNFKVFGCDADRYMSYRLMFAEMLRVKNHDFTIIETGCAFGGGWCHGSSSFLFLEFLNIFGGKLISIDINPEHMEACKQLLTTVQPKSGRAGFNPMVGDSVTALASLPDSADLIYFDSWDLERDDPEPSQRHHFAEFKAAKPIFMRSQNLIVAVDDNLKPLGIGKGKYILEWAQKTNQKILWDDYQLVMRLTSQSVRDL